MVDIDKLNKSVGCLEGKVDMLIHNQNRLVTSMDNLSKALRHKTWYDSAKVISGAFCGGFAAIVLKLVLWD